MDKQIHELWRILGTFVKFLRYMITPFTINVNKHEFPTLTSKSIRITQYILSSMYASQTVIYLFTLVIIFIKRSIKESELLRIIIMIYVFIASSAALGTDFIYCHFPERITNILHLSEFLRRQVRGMKK